MSRSAQNVSISRVILSNTTWRYDSVEKAKGHALPALANNWTHGIGPAVQHADIPLTQSATLGFHPVARKLLLISRHVKGRRLSWREHTIG